MPLLERFNLLVDLALALKAALFPTIKRIIHEPSLLVRPTALSRVFMSYVWIVFGPAIDGSNAEVKTRLLTAHAFGVVLDIGAGEYFKYALCVVIWTRPSYQGMDTLSNTLTGPRSPNT